MRGSRACAPVDHRTVRIGQGRCSRKRQLAPGDYVELRRERPHVGIVHVCKAGDHSLKPPLRVEQWDLLLDPIDGLVQGNDEVVPERVVIGLRHKCCDDVGVARGEREVANLSPLPLPPELLLRAASYGPHLLDEWGDLQNRILRRAGGLDECAAHVGGR
jgi:hypothetical protein